MPLMSPCSDEGACDDLANCSIIDLGDVNEPSPNPCTPGTFLMCKGDGTFEWFEPPMAHIGTTSVQQSIPAGSQQMLGNLASTYHDNSNMVGASSINIPIAGYYQVVSDVYIDPSAEGEAQLSLLFNGGVGGQGHTTLSPNASWNDMSMKANNFGCLPAGMNVALDVENDSSGAGVITVASLFVKWIGPC